MGLSQSLQSATGGHTDDLIRHTLALAKYPNVSVKLSSVANHSHEDYPYRDINVHIRRVFDVADAAAVRSNTIRGSIDVDYDRSTATRPPAVPDGRRPLVHDYFVRPAEKAAATRTP